MAGEIRKFSEGIGASPVQKNSVFKRPNYFFLNNLLLVVKVSRSLKPFWGIGEKVVEYLNEKNFEYRFVFLDTENSGWSFSRAEIEELIFSRKWRVAESDKNFKINMPLPDPNRFHSTEAFLNLVFPEKIESFLPEEVVNPSKFYEGAVHRIAINSYERNAKARQICLNHYGFACHVCGTKLDEIYGSIAQNYIHVHHIVPLSQVKENYQIDPIKDLIPICPNCHSIIHRENPPLEVEKLKWLIKGN